MNKQINLKGNYLSKKIYLYIVFISILVFTTSWTTQNIKSNTIVSSTLFESNESFSKEALIDLLKECHIKYPHIVLAQAYLESGYFTSKIFKENNNMFGMRKATQRVTTAKGEKNTFAYYENWMDCVYDYAMYQSSVMDDVNSEEEYLSRLSASYAQDPRYMINLKRIIVDGKIKNIFKD